MNPAQRPADGGEKWRSSLHGLPTKQAQSQVLSLFATTAGRPQELGGYRHKVDYTHTHTHIYIERERERECIYIKI